MLTASTAFADTTLFMYMGVAVGPEIFHTILCILKAKLVRFLGKSRMMFIYYIP